MQASFESSRRLTGPNLFSDQPGAVLEAMGSVPSETLAQWRRLLQRGRALLDWPAGHASITRPHKYGVSLFIEAPVDLLLAATELNEWAWQSARQCAETHAPGHPLAGDDELAFETLRRMIRAEQHPDFRAFHAEHSLVHAPLLWDDERVSLGVGRFCRSVDWQQVGGHVLPIHGDIHGQVGHSVPVALVTGSNGKTTSVRVLAAMLRAQGFSTAHNCTDGLYLNGERLARGDYSGPQGAREVLRHPLAEAAVLETARGGLLRRGLAFTAADAALVTNISDDHFGEYGIDTLDELAEAKLVVAKGLKPDGHLVLNADDPLLVRYGPTRFDRIDWFGFDPGHPEIRAAPAAAWVDQDILWLRVGGRTTQLGAIADMPLSVQGIARYNVANLMGAALVARRLGVSEEAIRNVLHRFGRKHGDNPGRLQRYRIRGIDVLTDYAHNPDGLANLLDVGRRLNAEGRLALVLGQAGNRDNAEILALADVALRFRPDYIVLKDLQGYMRGRAFGEIPQLLREHLLDCGFDPANLRHEQAELDAVRACLEWAEPGDLLVLPVHSATAQEAVSTMLSQVADPEDGD